MKTIVAAIDTSESSRLVFRETLVLAVSIRASVVAVSVTPQYEGNMNRMCLENTDDLLSEPARKILAESKEYAESLGLELQTIHRKGKASSEILAVAREKNAAVIVLGCARRHQIERMLLGRTTAEVIAESPCDVMLLPEQSTIRLSNITVGLNEAAANRRVQSRALDIARSYGGRVTGLYAVYLPTEKALRYGVIRDAEVNARGVLRAFEQLALELEVPVATTISWDPPEKALVDYSTANEVDIIVVGAENNASLLEVWGGSLIERLASSTCCPVLIAKCAGGANQQEGGGSAFVFEE